jgi:heterodisulfide reductase subunit A-like polyferredoxin
MLKQEYSLAHLTVLGCAPSEMTYIAARAGYDYVSIRPISIGLPHEPNYALPDNPQMLKQTKTALAYPVAKMQQATSVAVVGAGPAGLAARACLRKAGLDFIILEKEDQVGASWRRHYARLHLHTVKQYSSLPFYPFPKMRARERGLFALRHLGGVARVAGGTTPPDEEDRQSAGAWRKSPEPCGRT